MQKAQKNGNATHREEDYREYEERDRDDGWPYADQDNLPSAPNDPYGTAPNNRDASSNPGVELVAEEVETKGMQAAEAPEEAASSVIADDVLELTVMEMLDADPRLDASNVTVRVDDGIVELDGKVETQMEKALAATLARSVAGVRQVIDAIGTLAAESHIPIDHDT